MAEQTNRRIRAAAGNLIAQAQREGRRDGGVARTLDGNGQVVTNDGRTAQVTILYTDFLAGTAHPIQYVTTTVIDVASATPLRLSDVFPDQPAAFRALRPEIIKAARRKNEDITDSGGLAPNPKNWAAWQTTPTGMTFWFGDYQLGGHGLRSYTVPWSAIKPLISPQASERLAPR